MAEGDLQKLIYFAVKCFRQSVNPSLAQIKPSSIPCLGCLFFVEAMKF